MLDRIRGGLIVSIQPEAESALNSPAFVAAFARCAQENGAAAVRIEGAERIGAVRHAVSVPIVGLIKRRDGDFAPYITTAVADVEAIARAGADVIAFDATPRERASGATVPDLIEAIHDQGALAMADCATLEEGRAAAESGADIVATTLFGYTEATRGATLPAIALVREFASLHPFAVCEGGIAQPEHVQFAFAAGASAVCAGTAISNVDALVRRFANVTPKRRDS